jgi:hypothetical protein
MGFATDVADLEAADEQGERVIASLWPGDAFIFRGQMHTIKTLQLHTDQESIFVTCVDGKVYLLNGLLMFPSFLTDEHFDAEQNREW